MQQTTITLKGPGIEETEHLDIQISVDATVNITSKAARRLVTGWLVSEVGNMLLAGVPQLVIGQHIIWRVPALLTSSLSGVVGEVGAVDVDAESGTLLLDEGLQNLLLENARKIVGSEHSETDWEYLRNLPDSEVDLSDTPEITPEQMKRAIARIDGKPVPPEKVRVNREGL